MAFGIGRAFHQAHVLASQVFGDVVEKRGDGGVEGRSLGLSLPPRLRCRRPQAAHGTSEMIVVVYHFGSEESTVEGQILGNSRDADLYARVSAAFGATELARLGTAASRALGPHELQLRAD